MKLLFLDTETTGLNDARLVELAFNVDGSAAFTQAFFKPSKPIEMGAQLIHGYSNEMMENEIAFEGSPDKVGLQMLLDTHIVVAHNAAFDIRVLQNEGLKVRQSLCTYQMAKDMYPNSACHKLQWLRYSLGLKQQGNAHSAIGDTMVLKALFNHMRVEREKSMDPIDYKSSLMQRFVVNY